MSHEALIRVLARIAPHCVPRGMSYTPDDQLLREPITELLNASKRVRLVFQARREAGDYNDDHIEEIDELEKRMIDLERDLRKLQAGTR